MLPFRPDKILVTVIRTIEIIISNIYWSSVCFLRIGTTTNY